MSADRRAVREEGGTETISVPLMCARTRVCIGERAGVKGVCVCVVVGGASLPSPLDCLMTARALHSFGKRITEMEEKKHLQKSAAFAEVSHKKSPGRK